MKKSLDFDTLVESAVRSYLAAGRYAHGFARGKLRHDPVFRALLEHGMLPREGLLLDLGCGLGVLPALLHEAHRCHLSGEWVAGWPEPPRLELYGIELSEKKAQNGRLALEGKATIRQGDIRNAEFPECSVAVILDVLLYLNAEEQEQTLRRVARVLCPGGLLLLREGDASAGIRFHATRLAEQVCCLWRGQGWYPLHYRPAVEWAELLQRLGFSVAMQPMSEGTPFGNVLFVAKKGGG